MSDCRPKLAPSEGFKVLPAGVSKSRLESKRYVLCPNLAETMVPFLLKDDGCDLILEINPGESVADSVLSDAHPSCTLSLTTRGLPAAQRSPCYGMVLQQFARPKTVRSDMLVYSTVSPRCLQSPSPRKTLILLFRESFSRI